MIFPLVDYSNGWRRAVHQHESIECEESMCLITGAVLFILHSKQGISVFMEISLRVDFSVFF